MKNLDIVKMLTVSISHITKETADRLSSEDISNKMRLSVYIKATKHGPDYGFYIDINPKNLDYDNIPKDLAPLIRLAVENDCRVLCLDYDGQELKGYKTYEWESEWL